MVHKNKDMVRKKGFRRLLAILISAALLLTFTPPVMAAWDGATTTDFTADPLNSGCDGQSAATAWQISTPEELAFLADSVSAGVYTSDYFILTADLDLGGQPWTPIGGDANEFQGHFDGNNHRIDNVALTTPGTGQYTGLFGHTNGAAIQNLTVTTPNNYNLDLTATPAEWNCGVLVGRMVGGTIDNCKVDIQGTLTASSTKIGPLWYFGVLAGYVDNNSTISNSSSSGTVSVSQAQQGVNAGGLIGDNYGAVSNCSSSVQFSGIASGLSVTVGGLFGRSYVSGDTVDTCQATGSISNVTAINNVFAGGFTGFIGDPSSQITDCSSSVDITGITVNDGKVYAGGFAGDLANNTISLTNCSATGNISTIDCSGPFGFGYIYAGGFCGRSQNGNSLSDCSSSGSVDDLDADQGLICAGGFTGIDHGGITDSSATGSISNLVAPVYIYAGGFTGDHGGGVIGGCSATGNVDVDHTANGDTLNNHPLYEGGFAGLSDAGTITESYARGNITGKNFNSQYGDIYAGGFAGHSKTTNVSDCYAVGTVLASSDASTIADIYSGGFVGYTATNGSVNNCYSGAGAVTGTDASSSGNIYVGGFAGSYGGSISNAYWLAGSTVNGSGSGAGAVNLTGLTANQLQNNVTFTFNGNPTLIVDALNSVSPATWMKDPAQNNGYPIFGFAAAGLAITSANSTTFTVGSAGTFTVTATGNPAPTFSVNGPPLPSGVSFNTATGILSGTPGAGSGGGYHITITASNGVLPVATQNFTLTVNEAPAITSANSATFTVGSAGSFTVTTTSCYPALLTFSENGALPSGVSLDAATGILSGTPGAGSGGVYPIAITASNGVLPDATQNFTLTVNTSVPTGGGGGGGGGRGASASSTLTLSKGSAAREDKSTAVVHFDANSVGAYYYAVVKSGAAAPTIDTTKTGQSLAKGTNTLKLTSLANSNSFDLYLAGKTAKGKLSNVLKISIPENNDIAEKFSDIGSSWALHYTQLLYDAGIRHGQPDGTMRPDAPVTKAELATLLVQALNLPTATGITMSFKDMGSIPDWAEHYIQTCVDNGILTGDNNGFIRASDPVTRNEAAVMLMRAFNLTPVPGTPAFADTVPDWAATAVNTLVAAGVLSGYPDGTFGGANNLTNAQIDKMLCILLKLV